MWSPASRKASFRDCLSGLGVSAALGLALISVPPAQATQVVTACGGATTAVKVGRLIYTIGCQEGTLPDLADVLEQQPWYTGVDVLATMFPTFDSFDPSGFELAEQFAALSGSQLGKPNLNFINDEVGPFFAYFYNPEWLNPDPAASQENFEGQQVQFVFSVNPTRFGGISTSRPPDGFLGPYTYAVVLSQRDVPGPLPVFGVGAALAFSRGLRARIRFTDSTNQDPDS
jgi:hypothetical protein